MRLKCTVGRKKIFVFVLGNGVLLLGQEQDAPGSKFSASESFRGSLTRLNIWNRALTRSEISEAMNSCFEVTGNVASWADFNNGINGLIKVNPLKKFRVTIKNSH